MKDTLLFIDPTCPRPYDPSCIDGKGVGGTEQTIVTIAEGLSEIYNVVVEQHNRFEGETFNGKAIYTYPGYCKNAKYVIVLRDPRPMLDARRRFKDARIYLYSHDLATRDLGLLYNRGVFLNSGCLANICVSQWHKSQSIETLIPFGYQGEFRHRFIYNPISEDVVRTSEPYDKNKLIWLASPHKGLARALEIFPLLLKLNPEFKLYITNPGYMEDVKDVPKNTIVLGTLPHTDVIAHLRNSLCLFYPNTVFPETFGKIMSEANAVGCPVLTHAIGASREVLDSHPDQIADCRDTEAVVKRVMKWYNGARPIIRGNPKFRLSNVINEWGKILHDIR